MKKRLQKKVVTRCLRNAQDWLDYYNSLGDSCEGMVSHHAVKTLCRLDFLLESHQTKTALAMAQDEWKHTMHPAPHPVATKIVEAQFHSHQQVLEDREIEQMEQSALQHADEFQSPDDVAVYDDLEANGSAEIDYPDDDLPF